ncbi:hypothetical protein R1flu_013861 [Riccia fluitans]|uniref:Ribosomal protein L2 n=1 Tax=Riccia fluitans TaxID=41844 RepID=A0ABD1YET6_9MARC
MVTKGRKNKWPFIPKAKHRKGGGEKGGVHGRGGRGEGKCLPRIVPTSRMQKHGSGEPKQRGRCSQSGQHFRGTWEGFFRLRIQTGVPESSQIGIQANAHGCTRAGHKAIFTIADLGEFTVERSDRRVQWEWATPSFLPRSNQEASRREHRTTAWAVGRGDLDRQRKAGRSELAVLQLPELEADCKFPCFSASVKSVGS